MSNSKNAGIDLEKLFLEHDLLYADGFSLPKPSFSDSYDKVLVPVLKKLKKRIYVIQAVYEKLKDDSKIFDKFFKIQKYIVVTQEGSIPEVLHLNKDKKILVIVGSSTTGNQVLKHKQTAIMFDEKGFSRFSAQSQNKPQTHRETITNLSTEKMQIQGDIPTESSTIHYKLNNTNKDIVLKRKLADGGEGVIYETDSSYIAKIYKQDEQNKSLLNVPNYTPEKLKKFQKISKDKNFKGHVFLPLHIAYNSKNECIGFLMEKAEGKPIQYILGGKKERDKHYPNLNYKDLIEMCINFLKLAVKLHEKNIIIGDVNSNNILFLGNKISLIDCDSFQIDKFPCPVTTQAFLHPAHRGKNINVFMRSLSDEYYAIAVFLFMLVTLGRHPYDCQGSNRDKFQKENKFPYIVCGVGKKTIKSSQEKWQRLNQVLQECFYNTFQKGGKYCSEKTILGPKVWLTHFTNFYRSLK